MPGVRETSEAIASPGEIRIVADIAPSFTYASFQNAIPIVRAISIENPTSETLAACRLELTSTPSFLRPKTWIMDHIAAGETCLLTDRRVDLDASYLMGLNEAERGDIALRLFAGERLVTEAHVSVRLLARDEWGGVADMLQLLPAFVMPNDPAVPPILRDASERLLRHGHAPGLDGYQSGNPQRVYLIAAAIYSTVSALALHYAEPPASFESRGQKVRRPGTITGDALATCLDTSLLFAAALEAAGLHPMVMMFRGHAAVGVWLTSRSTQGTIESDAMELRKALSAREMIVFETTGVTHRPPLPFEHAQQLVEARLDESAAADFVAAIDIRRARSGGIMPLASHQPAPAPAPMAGENIDLPLPEAPDDLGQPPDIVEVKPTTAQGRIDRWQKKLLDLTLRNRLLNLRANRKTIPFLCTDVAYLEDRLAEGAAVRLISLPQQNPVGERDQQLHRDGGGRDFNRTFATEALGRDELASPLPQDELDKRLIELHRQARSDIAEGGTNTLFLAVGFLRWKEKQTDERVFLAPLLLVPVRLDRKSASSRFALRGHEDEPRFNATLVQFLERDFGLKLTGFDDLPRDDNGIDVQRILGQVRQAVRDVPGMEVVDDAALSTFSFAKFLMWKDLVERTDALRNNRVVRHLIDTPELAFEGADVPFRDGHDLDRTCAPADLVSLLPADSSQLAACLAAAEGRDFVIVGPPGTGKSQTIANMIANCLAAGKTVLFVAEKTAALNVVHRRLREHGLGASCIELHSSKADRKTLLNQLRASWESRTRFNEDDWVTVNERLRVRRDELNAYVEALHRRYPNGLSAYAAMGLALRGKDRDAPVLSWAAPDAHDQATRRNLEMLAADLGRVFAAVGARNAPGLALVDRDTWSASWQDDLLAAGATLQAASGALRTALSELLARIGLPAADDGALDGLRRLSVFAAALRQRGPRPWHDIRSAAQARARRAERSAIRDLRLSRRRVRPVRSLCPRRRDAHPGRRNRAGLARRIGLVLADELARAAKRRQAAERLCGGRVVRSRTRHRAAAPDAADPRCSDRRATGPLRRLRRARHRHRGGGAPYRERRTPARFAGESRPPDRRDQNHRPRYRAIARTGHERVSRTRSAAAGGRRPCPRADRVRRGGRRIRHAGWP